MVTTTKTAIITGASSFVGCHLAPAFAAAGYNVIATTTRDIDAYEGIRAERLAQVSKVATMAILDIEDGKAVSAFVEARQPGLWVHHAGFADQYHALDHDFARSVAVNVRPLAALFEALEGANTGKDCGVIITGSSAEYADGDEADREDDEGDPVLPYGTAKLMETVEAASLAELHGVPTRVARLYIPFGPMDHPQKLLTLVTKALQGRKPIDLSPCEQRRDFIAVGDVCKAYLKLADDMERTKFDIFNICSGEATALKSLLEMLADHMGADKCLLKFGAIAMRHGEAPISFGANEKAKAILNWQPQPLKTSIATLMQTEILT